MSLFTNFFDLAKSIKLALSRKADRSELAAYANKVDDVRDAEGNSLVVDKIATLPVIPEYGKMFEIVDYTEGGNTYIKYTGSELYDLINGINRDTVYCYYGKPIQYCRFVASDDHRFAVLTAGISTLPSMLEYRLNGKRVVSSQNYGWASETPYTVNEKIKLSLIEERAQKNVQPDWNQTDTTADDFIKNKPSGKWALIAQKTLTEAAQYIDFTLDEGITDFILLAKIHKPSSATNMLLWIGTSLDNEQQISQRALGNAATALEIIDVNLLPEVACEARGIHHNTIDQGGITAMTAYANCNTNAANLPSAITWIDCHFSQAVSAGTQISIFAKN